MCNVGSCLPLNADECVTFSKKNRREVQKWNMIMLWHVLRETRTTRRFSRAARKTAYPYTTQSITVSLSGWLFSRNLLSSPFTYLISAFMTLSCWSFRWWGSPPSGSRRIKCAATTYTLRLRCWCWMELESQLYAGNSVWLSKRSDDIVKLNDKSSTIAVQFRVLCVSNIYMNRKFHTDARSIEWEWLASTQFD